MSRIGRLPIAIPSGVTVDINGDTVKVKGAKGELTRKIESKNITVKNDNGHIVLARSAEDKDTKAKHGLYRALINNMVVGVNSGFSKKLIVAGVGYKCQANGEKLTMNIGFSHPVEMMAPKGIKVNCPTATEIEVSGADKEQVGLFAAAIKAIKKVEPYHGYGIHYSDERVIRKEGKKASK